MSKDSTSALKYHDSTKDFTIQIRWQIYAIDHRHVSSIKSSPVIIDQIMCYMFLDFFFLNEKQHL